MRVLRDEPRLNRDALRYGFAVGKIRVLETRTIDNAAYERLIAAPSYTEQKRLLAETPYGRYLEQAWTAEEIEEALDRALAGFYRFLEEAELPPVVVRFFRIRHDFTNLKAMAKASAFGVPVDDMLVSHGTVPKERFFGEQADLPEPLRSVQIDVQGSVVDIDSAVDRALFIELCDLAHAARSPFLERVTELFIDIANTKTLVRGRLVDMPAADVADLIIEGGSMSRAQAAVLARLSLEDLTEDLTRLQHLKGIEPDALRDTASLDLATDAALMRALREGRQVPIGPEPVISYVLAREVEISALRVLLLGKLGNIDPDTLRARLRAAYR